MDLVPYDRNKAATQKEDVSQIMHKSLPLLAREEYARLYKTRSDDQTQRTFDFQGYVRDEKGKIFFIDVLATNRLRGDIHVGIDGTVSYNHSYSDLREPEQVGEYVLYIQVPGETQKKEGIVVQFDFCKSVENLINSERRNNIPEEDIQKEIDHIQKSEGYIVVRLDFEPKENPQAREKVKMFNHFLVQYINRGHNLARLHAYMRALEQIVLENPDSSEIARLAVQ